MISSRFGSAIRLMALFFSVPIQAVSENPMNQQMRIRDPFLWLEEMSSPRTRAFIEKQNRQTDDYFKMAKMRAPISRIVEKFSKIETRGPMVRRGDVEYFLQTGLQRDRATLVATSSSGTKTIVDLDQMGLPENFSLRGFKICEDGSTLAYALSESGSDDTVWKFIDLKNGRQIAHLKGIKFSSPQLSKDGKRIYYIAYQNTPGLLHGIYCHTISKFPVEGSQLRDTLLCDLSSLADSVNTSSYMASDETLFLFSSRDPTTKKKAIWSYSMTEKALTCLFTPDTSETYPIGKRGSALYFLTNREHSHFQLIKIHGDVKSGYAYEELIKDDGADIDEAVLKADHIAVKFCRGTEHQLRLYTLNGTFIKEIPLPPFTSFYPSQESGCDDRFRIQLASYKVPLEQYEYDIETEELTPLYTYSTTSNTSLNHTSFTIPSKDGTQVPLTLISKGQIERAPETPMLLYGYGGFGISLAPAYSPLYHAWIEMGGAVAIAHIRGGGEFGKNWHHLGKLHNKHNSFDDFIATAEWLIQEGYTSKERLGILGRSNGGLLVGACITKRPDLFAAAVPQVGVLDLLCFHKYTIGRAWISEYGNPESRSDFPMLLSYSPYHNIRIDTSYPSTLVTTAECDDRVVPLHSYKFTAKLQQNQAGDAPILLRVYPQSGHFKGLVRSQAILENTEILTFLAKELTVNVPNGTPQATSEN